MQALSSPASTFITAITRQEKGKQQPTECQQDTFTLLEG
jgi:hypothetical protein